MSSRASSSRSTKSSKSASSPRSGSRAGSSRSVRSSNGASDDQDLAKYLNESGVRDRLRLKLVKSLNETGWRDQVKLNILEFIQEKGMENVSVEDCMKAMAMKARGLVPESIVKDLQKDVKKTLKEENIAI